jgi:hypothetical protein
LSIVTIDKYNIAYCRRIPWHQLLLNASTHACSLFICFDLLHALCSLVPLSRLTSFSHVHNLAICCLITTFYTYAGFITALRWNYSIFGKDMEYTPYAASSSVSHISLLEEVLGWRFCLYGDFLVISFVNCT